jgi:hypothetical protein
VWGSKRESPKKHQQRQQLASGIQGRKPGMVTSENENLLQNSSHQRKRSYTIDHQAQGLIELTYQYFFQDFCIHAAVPPGQWTKD